MIVKAIQVEVFSSPGCNRCSQVFDVLQTITRDLGAKRIDWREVNVLDELDYAVELGVLSMPAIAIDGKLVFKSHPSAGKLRDALEARLKLMHKGVVVPTDNDRDLRVQAGAVATFFRRRHEWDLDALWVQGTGNAPNAARYDISWQYRLTPATYPEWGAATEWDGVLELNGRWVEGNTMVHQATAGLQWIHRRWVLEGGVVQDFNGPEDTRLVLSMRIHF